MGTHWNDGYSAQVDMYLVIDGDRVGVAQVGPGWFILEDDRAIPPETDAELVIAIDGRETKRRIFLHEGAIRQGTEVAYF
jgi:hypothetical protein